MDQWNTIGTQTCTYAYDDLARSSSSNCGSAWSQTFAYDRYGNITKSGSISWMPGYSAATNRYTLGGTSYDNNGNLLKDTFHTYSWSVDNRPTQVDSTTITYDALGQQVEKNVSGTYTEFLYSPIGKVAYMNGQTTNRSLIPLPGGGTFECIGSPCGVYAYQEFHHKDWLGSSRLISENGNRAIWSDMAFAPFGENYAGSGQTDLNFTGQQQDTVSGTYDFPARRYNPNQGRWLSPDPAGLGAVNPANPQSWNRYAYLGNSPLTATDPSGMCEGKSGAADIGPCQSGGSPDPDVADAGGPSFLIPAFNMCYPAECGLIGVIGGSDAMPTLAPSGGGGGDAPTSGIPAPGEGIETVLSVDPGFFNRDTFDRATGRDTSDVVIGNNAAALAPAMNAGASFVNRSVANMTMGGVTGGVLGYGLGEFVGGFIEGYTSQVRTGMQLWRVFGGKARGLSPSWTSVNPANVPNYRVAAGLYPGNSGGFLLRGTLNNTEGVLFRSALPGPGGIGGGIPEIIVPNPMVQININGVWGVNPPF